MRCQGDSNTCQNEATIEIEVLTKHGFDAVRIDEALPADHTYESRSTRLCDKHAEYLKNNVTVLSEKRI